MDTGFRDPRTPYCGHPPSVPWEKSGDGYRNVSLCGICWTSLHLLVKVQYSDHCNADDVMFMETVYSDPSIMGSFISRHHNNCAHVNTNVYKCVPIQSHFSVF